MFAFNRLIVSDLLEQVKPSSWCKGIYKELHSCYILSPVSCEYVHVKSLGQGGDMSHTRKYWRGLSQMSLIL